MPARIELIAGLALVCLMPAVASAQAPQWPSPQDVELALKATPFPGNDRIGSQPVPQVPRVTPKVTPIDIESIARSKLQLPSAAAPSVPLRIFITLDMPRASLQLLTEQAARTGAVLVLRGLKAQSMRQTIAIVGELIGDRKVAWVIDPEAFTRFAVRQAPTFVLSLNDAQDADTQSNCSSGCATPVSFVSVSGDVSLDYALETMLRRRPETTPRADPILKRLRAS